MRDKLSRLYCPELTFTHKRLHFVQLTAVRMGARLGWQSLMISANRASAQACPNELAAPRSSGADVHVCRYCKRPIYPVLPGRDCWSAPSGHWRPRMCSHVGSGPCNRRGALKWPPHACARDSAHGFLLSFDGDIFVPSCLTPPPSIQSSFIRPCVSPGSSCVCDMYECVVFLEDRRTYREKARTE